MKKQTLALWALAIGLLTSCSSSKRPDLGDGLFAEINTSMGTVIFALEQEKTPVTVASFVSLAEGDNPYVSETYKNKKFYDGLTFHRVALLGANFIIQGGDPEGTGMGGPGYQFKDEIDEWIIKEFEKIGLDTAKSVLENDLKELVKRTDLEEETIQEVLNILKEEFED